MLLTHLSRLPLLVRLLGLLILLYGPVAWWGVPAVVDHLLRGEVANQLGRAVSARDIRFNPLTLTLQLDGLSVAAATGSAPPLLEVDRIRVNASLASVWHRAPVIEAVEVEGPHLSLTRSAPGHYDIDDLLARWSERPATSQADADPARFALYNLSLTGGRVELVDQVKGLTHKLTHLTVGLPFLTNLHQTDREVHVEPRLAFELDGSSFDSRGRVTPFDPNLPSSLTLKVSKIDLAHWHAYLPAILPVLPGSGHMSLDLTAEFSASSAARQDLSLKGSLAVADLKLVDPQGQVLASVGQAELRLGSVQPLRRRVELDRLSLAGLDLYLERDRQGRLNWLRALTGEAAKAPAVGPAGDASVALAAKAATPPKSAGASAEADWRIALTRFELKSLTNHWRDMAVRPGVDLAFQVTEASGENWRWPLVSEGEPARLQVALEATQAAGPSAGSLTLDARQTLAGGSAEVQVQGLNLSMANPYLVPWLRPRVDGRLALDGTASWAGLPGDQAPVLKLASLSVDSFRLSEPDQREALLTWHRADWSHVEVDPAGRKLTVGRWQIDQPRLLAVRDKAGALNLAKLLVAPAKSGEQAATSLQDPSAPAKEAPDWQLDLQQFKLDGGQLAWRDASPRSAPVALDLRALQVGLEGLRWPASQASQAKLQISGRLQAAGSPAVAPGQGAGKLKWSGQISLAPLAWSGRAQLERLPGQLFAPYLAEAWPLELLHGDGSWQGQIRGQLGPRGLDLDMQGDARLDNLHLNGQRAADLSGDELLSWQALTLQGLQFSIAPGRTSRLEIANTTLTDLFARLLVTEQGHLNLNDLTAAPAALAGGPGSSVASTVAASGNPASVAGASSAPPLDLTLGGVQLNNGRIDFTDRFIRPNYRTELSELSGRLGPLRAGSKDMATLSLRGKAAGTAMLEISGALNPMVPAMDILAKASDLELAPLTAYAGKYAGYAIERGKLTVALRYRIAPDGRLEANNRIVLNQLNFGERVESPSATQLPVLLAVALLKDSQGVIDLDLPISGSINEPQFSVGGLVLKVIVNLLSKAVTSPFALLSGGDGADLSQVEFVPGTARLSNASQETLTAVANALTRKPSLQMTVTGVVDIETEREAMQLDWLERRLQTEWRKQGLQAGVDPAQQDQAPPLTASERQRLLQRVYDQTALPGKPRNLFGMAKTLSASEMETLLKASAPVTADAARDLALQRGLTVRETLSARGLAVERLFLAAPKVRTKPDDPIAQAGAQLSLSAH